MKMNQRTHSHGTQRRRSAGLAWTAIIALVALVMVVSQAQPVRAGGGDAIGVMPLTASNPFEPAVVIEGETSSVLAAIGRGLSAKVTIRGNVARATFRGVGLLSVDRASVAGGKLRVYLDSGPVFAGGFSALVAGARRMGIQLLPAGLLDLRLNRLERSGLLDEAILDLYHFGPVRRHKQMRLSASGAWIRIEFKP
jgi:hypothetical protein